jgi:hypothetical protein
MSSNGTRALASRLARASTKLAVAREQTAVLTRERDALILELVGEGCSYATVTELCGLSRGRIAQIVAAA